MAIRRFDYVETAPVARYVQDSTKFGPLQESGRVIANCSVARHSSISMNGYTGARQVYHALFENGYKDFVVFYNTALARFYQRYALIGND
jgi:hypothetical protein